MSPRPTDVLHTFSDFSAANKAVGGRLVIHRQDHDGSVKKLLGGHFSCRVWKRSKKGAFSTSARISTFLSGLSALDIELVYTPGKDMKSSDYSSRHPITCKEERCQICSFACKLEKLGDNAFPMVGKTVEDIEQGRLKMPFTQKKAWLKVQAQDRNHQQLSWLINTSQTPEKKKTKGENTKLKLLHNLYKNGTLKIDSEGLITVTNADKDTGNTQAISVPTDIYPGLLQAIHLKLNHPSKAQMHRLSSRYFYSPGQARIIDEISNKCSVCASLKQLPAKLFSESPVENETFGSHFQQMLFVVKAS